MILAHNDHIGQNGLNAYQTMISELQASAIDGCFIDNTFISHEGGQSGLDLFLSECEIPLKDRLNNGRVSSTILKRYDHLTYGFWYVKSYDPISNESFIAQYKPFIPREELKKDKHTGQWQKTGKTVKYETPLGKNTPIILPYLPLKVIHQLANKYKIDVLPEDTDSAKWAWVKDNPQIPITITEGVKKACSLISNGFIAIASMSITTHSEKATDETSSWFTELKPALLWVLGNTPRTVYIAFDREDLTREASIKAVRQQTKTLGYKLAKKGHIVKVLIWSPTDGKGIDDFIAKKGKKALRELFNKAITYKRFVAQLNVDFHYKLSYPTITINQQFMDVDLISMMVNNGKKFVGLKASQKCGKTTAIANFIKQEALKGKKVLSISFRQLLARFCSDEFNLHCYLDNFNLEEYYSGNGDSISFDSLLKISPDSVYDYIILDEIEQGLWHLLHSPTEIKNKRGDVIIRLNELINNCLVNGGSIIGMDADLTDKAIDYIRDNCGESTIAKDDVTCIKNEFKPFDGRELIMIDNITDFRAKLIDYLDSGKRFMVCLSGQKVTSTNGSINIEQLALRHGYSQDDIYRIDQETISDPDHKCFGIIDNPEKLKQAKLILATASLGTGVSLNVEKIGHLDAVFLCNGGNLGVTESEQIIERYRGDCPRICYLPQRSNANKKGNGAITKTKLEKHLMTRLNIAYSLANQNLNVFCHKQVGHFASFASRVNNDAQNLRLNFQIKMESKGYKLVEQETEKLDKEIAKKIKQEATEIREISEQSYTNDLFKTNCPEEDYYWELKKKRAKTHSERLTEKRGNIRQTYGELTKTENDYQLFHELVIADMKGCFNKLWLRFFMEFGHDFTLEYETMKAKKDLAYRQENESVSYFLDEIKRYDKSAKTFIAEKINYNFRELIGLADINSEEELTEFKELQSKKDKNDIEKAKRNKFCNERLVNNYQLADIVKDFTEAIDADLSAKFFFCRVFDINIDADHNPMTLFKLILNRLGYDLELVARVRGVDAGSPTRFYAIKSVINPLIIEEIYSNWLTRVSTEFEGDPSISNISNEGDPPISNISNEGDPPISNINYANVPF